MKAIEDIAYCGLTAFDSLEKFAERNLYLKNAMTVGLQKKLMD